MVMNEHVKVIKGLLESGYDIYQFLEKNDNNTGFVTEYIGQYNYETTVIEYNIGNETKKFNLLEGTYLYAVMYVSEIADGDILAVRYQPINNTYELAIDVNGKVVYADIVMHEVEPGYFNDKFNLLKALQDNIGYIILNLPDYIDWELKHTD